MTAWLERTWKTRILVFAGLALAGTVYFASLGMWRQAGWGAVVTLLNLVFLLVPMPGPKPSVAPLDIEKSIRKVGARKDP